MPAPLQKMFVCVLIYIYIHVYIETARLKDFDGIVRPKIRAFVPRRKNRATQ